MTGLFMKIFKEALKIYLNKPQNNLDFTKNCKQKLKLKTEIYLENSTKI